jgi:uncharacterized protein (TIGR03382 family)
MFAMAAALLPTATETQAAPKGATVINPASLTDTAPVGGTPVRLKRTDEEQPGNEMPAAAIFGKKGLYFVATTELNGVRANRRIQGALIPFDLVNEGGTIKAVPNMTGAKYITNNNGNEYRQFNNSTVSTVKVGNQDYAIVQYNYQENNGNGNTERYIQVFKSDGTLVLGQSVINAKNNDDCSMHQDGSPGVTLTEGNKVKMFNYAGCNGNGNDDGWVFAHELTFSADGNTATLQKMWDVSVCPREERSRGTVRLSADKKALIVAWTEGNTQPQRDGVWMAGLDLTKNAQGANQQQLIAWKQQIDGRVDQDGVRTYSMRMKMEQLPKTDGTADDRYFIQYGHLRGNNNTNGKGGTYIRSMTGVVKADLSGVTFEVPLTDMGTTAMLGIDGTHLGAAFGMFGTEGAAVPGIAYLSGNHFGGSTKSSIRVVTMDGGQFTNAGTLVGGPHDRHLYPNYLGNNPGNQGRNHSHGQVIANPFASEGHPATQLLVYATTAKDTGDAGGATTSQLDKPEIKLAAWLSVIPVQAKASEPPPVDPGNPEPTDPTDPTDPGNEDPNAPSQLGGCSTGSSTGGLASFLLIGLAMFFRRRRA